MITLAHLHAAIEAGLSPVNRQLDAIRRDLLDTRSDVKDTAELLDTVADDIAALAKQLEARRRRLRRWLVDRATSAVVTTIDRLAIAAASVLATYLVTRFF